MPKFVHFYITGAVYKNILGGALPEDPSLISPGSIAAAVYTLRFVEGVDTGCILGYFIWITFFPLKALRMSMAACKTALDSQHLPYTTESCEETVRYDSCGCETQSHFIHTEKPHNDAELCGQCSPEGYRFKKPLEIVNKNCEEHEREMIRAA